MPQILELITCSIVNVFCFDHCQFYKEVNQGGRPFYLPQKSTWRLKKHTKV